jgi:hypothetical protein
MNGTKTVPFSIVNLGAKLEEKVIKPCLEDVLNSNAKLVVATISTLDFGNFQIQKK